MNVLLAAETGGSYVAAAYLVFLIVLLIYLGIMANKLVKLQRSLSENRKDADPKD
ncbi:MAG: hypothetical protein HYX29_06745 [Solirubrobacterales bacterium]|nr:hypothetical protein [Solirubrobacterales bacterium]